MFFYNYFKNSYNKIAIGLSKQQAYYAYSKAIQKMSFTVNLDGDSNRLIFFIIEKVKDTILDFTQRKHRECV